ncbi:exodeoxyribonuclease VII small subunit [Veillonella sp. R32]|uniref:exodeoxyribonuclease VII small subunit n=1 Tax=Veillonella sp. R32 TaxID=2021312 RepID=UPI001389E299|nr:exodeoxyribonuclease VII small subunit [Veillonella sp. R32]KAF1682367.1 exodeoxyribonuclease VII small subunit [Veillonella sp. R32]
MANTLKNYEKKYAALEEIVRTLDANELSVNDLLTQYKKGLTLVKECSDMLQSVEGEVRQIIEEVRIGDEMQK